MKTFNSILATLALFFALEANAQSERMMLIESFTNAGCVPCAQQNPAFDALLAANTEHVAAIKYHTNWPMANDPMYLPNADDIDARSAFYSVVSVPTAIIDGNRFFSAPSGVSQGIINQLLNVPSPVEMQLKLEPDSSGNRLAARIEGRATASMVGDVRLFVALVENEIQFETPPGPNGEQDFRHVLKRFLTNASGLSIGSLQAGDPFAFDFETELTTSQDLGHLSAIGWIQNLNTREIYQTCKSDATSNAVEEATPTTAIVFPNPTNGVVNIQCDGQKTGIYDLCGRCLHENDGERLLQFDLKPFGTGIYVVKIGCKVQKIVVR